MRGRCSTAYDVRMFAKYSQYYALLNTQVGWCACQAQVAFAKLQVCEQHNSRTQKHSTVMGYMHGEVTATSDVHACCNDGLN